MAKIIFLTLVLVAVVITVQGVPLKYEDVVAAAKGGQWDQIQALINGDLAQEVAWKPLAFDGVRNLKPSQGGHVYGEAEYTYHSAANIDGKTSEDAGGHKVINNDGKIKEFDFVPSTDKSAVSNPLPIIPFGSLLSLQQPGLQKSGEKTDPLNFSNIRNLKPVEGAHVYGEAEYSFHSASNIDGKTSEDTGGHKIINDNGKVNEFDFTPSPESLALKLTKFPDLSVLSKSFVEDHLKSLEH